MTDSSADDFSTIELTRRRIGQAAFMLVVAGLSVGIALFLLRQDLASIWILMATVGLLLALPLVNVVAVLAEEVGQRDWGFASLAAAVLALLGWALVSRVLGALQDK